MCLPFVHTCVWYMRLTIASLPISRLQLTQNQGVQLCVASTAARSQRNPTIANMIDAEQQLRKDDPERELKLRRNELELAFFRDQLKNAVAANNSKGVE